MVKEPWVLLIMQQIDEVHIEPLSCYLREPPSNPSWFPWTLSLHPSAEDAWASVKELDDHQEAQKCLGLNPTSRFAILQRDGFKCQLCGRMAVHGVQLEIDHKIPRSLGGNDTLDNLWTLCFECNRGKGSTAI